MILTISKEDYVKAIAEAEAEEGAVIAATIARIAAVAVFARSVKMVQARQVRDGAGIDG